MFIICSLVSGCIDQGASDLNHFIYTLCLRTKSFYFARGDIIYQFLFIPQLQSPSEEARECGCAMTAGLISEPGAIEELMKLNVVKILAPLMLDTSLDVRQKSLGALR